MKKGSSSTSKIVFGIAFWVCIGFWVWSSKKSVDQRRGEERAKQEYAKVACQNDPTCKSKEDDKKAQFDSIRSPDPVKSPSGSSFFKGKICPEICSVHVEGYRWAEKLGISKNFGCAELDEAREAGCKLYVEDRVDELVDELEKRKADRDAYESDRNAVDDRDGSADYRR